MRRLLPLALLLAGCSGETLCVNTEVVRMTAPDGKHDAVLFERNCGATTGFSSQVSIVGVGATVEGSGNVLVVDDDHGNAPAASWGGPPVELRWVAGSQLVVHRHPAARVFHQYGYVPGVQIIHLTD